MLSKQHFDEVEEQGFTIVPGIVSADEVSVLRAEVMESLSQDWQECRELPGKQEFIVLDLLQYCPSVVRLLENKIMHAMFSHFVSDTCILYSTTSTILRPEQHHYTAEIHTDTPRLVPGYHLGMLMTLALDDFTEDNGATYYLPRSHRSMDRPSDEEFYDNAVRVVRKAGDAVFFNPCVWHAGGHNNTDKARAGCTIYACRSWMRQRFDYPRMVDDRVLSLLGERGRAFLGFNVRVPTSMSEFYRLPEDRLYKPRQG